MKAVELHSFTKDGLVLAERAEPAVGPHEVKVRVRAVSLNYRDHMVTSGMYGIPAEALPLVPVSDGAGEVVAVGAAVTRFKVGDRVTSMMTRDFISGELTPERQAAQNGGPLDGMLQEYAVLPEHALVAFPSHLSYEEAATLPIAALTAWNALTEGGAAPGRTVLLQGTGGVSLAALQLAKLFGARVIITTSKEERRARLLELGADVVLNYKTSPDLAGEILAATDGRGVDMVIEVTGLSGMQTSLSVLRLGGYIGFVGLLAGMGDAPDFTLPLLFKNARIRGVLTGSRDMYEDMLRAIGQHQLKPIVGEVFALADFQRAFERYQSSAVFGKVVIRLD
ncbi:NAD(P)-dependent alcohol dehydrogenase [Massilia sp. BJB1822]|uniref:zinc-dependent alcohol dehydrogenase family protein n=1 Tax=Massilia sp. BJB1822 TaxID=2744470 RepID=UPI001592C07D|nr:NAD(P)-dependent alcohol dehydrogenase [Massilia sp. BJB1822]NVD99109.1 NAD(P)-dependent alcohol dehydrogenase [Massilia sp. BJB1822]